MLLLLILLFLLFGGFGFAVHALWFVLILLAVIYVAGCVRGGGYWW